MRVGDPTRAQRGEADGELSNRIRQEAGMIQRNPLVGQANRGVMSLKLLRHESQRTWAPASITH